MLSTNGAPNEGKRVERWVAVVAGLAGLVLGLILGLFGGTSAPSRVELTGTLAVVDSNNSGIAFTPDEEHQDLIPDDEEVVSGVLANMTGAAVAGGDSFRGYWLPEDQVLVIEQVLASD